MKQTRADVELATHGGFVFEGPGHTGLSDDGAHLAEGRGPWAVDHASRDLIGSETFAGGQRYWPRRCCHTALARV